MDHVAKVLVVDDDWTVRSVVSRVLEHQGWQVVRASGQTEAIEKMRTADPPFAVAVLDVMLAGGESGILLAEQLYRLDSQLRFLFISGHLDLDVTTAHVPRAAISFLGKPLSVTRLTEEVRALSRAPDFGAERQGGPGPRGGHTRR